MPQDILTSAAYRKAAGLSEPGADRDAPATPHAQSEDDLHRSVVDWLRSLEWSEPAPLMARAMREGR